MSDYWEEKKGYPIADWQYEVANGDTRQSYAEWCVTQEEMAGDDELPQPFLATVEDPCKAGGGCQVKLVTFMAKACVYAQIHIDDASAWSTDPTQREDYLQCTSFQMACFFAQNTRLGDGGVGWDVVLDKLVEHPMKSEAQWADILSEIAADCGGWLFQTNAEVRHEGNGVDLA